MNINGIEFSFSCDEELEELRWNCRAVAGALGLVGPEPLRVPDLQYVNRMADFIKAYPDRVIYEYTPGWFWKGNGGLVANDVITRMHARFKVVAWILQHECGIKHDYQTVVWNDGRTLAVALTYTEGEYDIPLITCSYTTGNYDHLDFISNEIVDVFDYGMIIEDGVKLVGFPSYNIHCLEDFLYMSGCLPKIVKNAGRFISNDPSRYESLPGAEALAADEEGMRNVELIIRSSSMYNPERYPEKFVYEDYQQPTVQAPGYEK